eukprot:4798701-Amphidinium_carterae.1
MARSGWAQYLSVCFRRASARLCLGDTFEVKDYVLRVVCGLLAGTEMSGLSRFALLLRTAH